MNEPILKQEDFDAWPEELRQVWTDLQLPGLHEMLATLERLSMEIRRQNQELRRLSQLAANPAPPLQPVTVHLPETLAAEMAALRAMVADSAEARLSSLILMADAIGLHAQALGRAAGEIHTLVPKAFGFFQTRPAWRSRLPVLLAAQVSGANMVRDKAWRILADLGVRPVPAACGMAFDPQLHLAVESVAQDPPGRIHEIVRPGWSTDQRLIRPAEVVVTRKESP